MPSLPRADAAFIASYPATSNAVLAARYGVTVSAIMQWAKHHGLRKDPSYRAQVAAANVALRPPMPRTELAGAGIYAVAHTNGSTYVGRAVNIRRRWRVHRNALERGVHANKVWQADWTRDGAGAFTFRVLESVNDVGRLQLAEGLWIASLKPAYNAAAIRAPTCTVQEPWRPALSAEASDRFWATVDKAGPAPTLELGPCWLWTGRLVAGGYGQANLDGPVRRAPAHRLAFALTHGEVPMGAFILHRCDVRRCVNPAHLYAGTPKDNARDMCQRQRLYVPRLQGTATGHARLCADQVHAIRLSRDEGATLAALAQAYGVHLSTIHLIVTRKRWRSVE